MSVNVSTSISMSLSERVTIAGQQSLQGGRGEVSAICRITNILTLAYSADVSKNFSQSRYRSVKGLTRMSTQPIYISVVRACRCSLVCVRTLNIPVARARRGSLVCARTHTYPWRVRVGAHSYVYATCI